MTENKIEEPDHHSEDGVMKALREEVREFKDCFTRFSFQAIAFSTAALGLMLKFPDHPLVTLSAVALIALLLGVARIGTFKYESANRLTGYELHLSRTRYLNDSKENGWQSWMRQLGFQEASRAWRVIQPNLFDYFYHTSFLVPPVFRRTHRNIDSELFWFDVERLVDSAGVTRVEYKPDTYLKVMLRLLYSIAAFSVLPVIIAAVRLKRGHDSKWIFFACVAIFLTATIIWRFLKDEGQRHLIESKFLSIHSCAVLWQAVIVAHYRAMKSLDDVGWRGYTRGLAFEAERLREQAFKIDEYIGSNAVQLPGAAGDSGSEPISSDQ